MKVRDRQDLAHGNTALPKGHLEVGPAQIRSG